MRAAPAFVVLAVWTFASCAAPAAETGDEWAEREQLAWDRLHRLKSELRWNHEGPVVFTFPGQGEVTVRDWWLEGGPGWEYVRAKFTYRNTTETPMDRVFVELSVQDEQGKSVVSSRIKLVHPWGYPIRPGWMFSDEISTPTDGAHLDPSGWHWTIGVHALPDVPIARSRTDARSRDLDRAVSDPDRAG